MTKKKSEQADSEAQEKVARIVEHMALPTFARGVTVHLEIEILHKLPKKPPISLPKKIIINKEVVFEDITSHVFVIHSDIELFLANKLPFNGIYFALTPLAKNKVEQFQAQMYEDHKKDSRRKTIVGYGASVELELSREQRIALIQHSIAQYVSTSEKDYQNIKAAYETAEGHRHNSKRLESLWKASASKALSAKITTKHRTEL